MQMTIVNTSKVIIMSFSKISLRLPWHQYYCFTGRKNIFIFQNILKHKIFLRHKVSSAFISVAVGEERTDKILSPCLPLFIAFGSVLKKPTIHKWLVLLKLEQHFHKTKPFELPNLPSKLSECCGTLIQGHCYDTTCRKLFSSLNPDLSLS